MNTALTMVEVIVVYEAVSFIIRRIAKMLDIKLLQEEVEKETREEELKRAKEQLKKMERDLRNARQIVANLERQKADLLVAISEGTN
jgi:signal recognition particle GTPase